MERNENYGRIPEPRTSNESQNSKYSCDSTGTTGSKIDSYVEILNTGKNSGKHGLKSD